MLRIDIDGVRIYRFETLAVEGLVHGVFTRLGGVSQGPFATLNVGHTVGDAPDAVAENQARIFSRMGTQAAQVVTARQVHGNHVAVVQAGDGGRVMDNTDGLVTAAPGLALMLRFADCQPIVLYDPVHHAVGLIHAGWRGIAQGMAYRAVEKMQGAFGTRPEALLAGLGPAIGPCCYTVGDDVASAMGYALPEWREAMTSLEEGQWRLDLSAANAQQLTAAGVRNIEQAQMCTSCHHDVFFSHRADQGRTGRFAAVVYLQARPGGPETAESAPLESAEPEEQAESDELSPPGFPSFGEMLENVP